MTSQDKETLITRTIVIGSLLCSAIAILIVIFSRTQWIIVLLGLVAAIILTWFLIQYIHRQGRSSGWLISLAILNLLIIFPEMSLRAVNFEYASKIEFDHPWSSPSVYYQPHEKLLWTLRPSDRNVNSLGFPGDEVSVPKPSDTYRILFLGDSVTQIGKYPEMVETLLGVSHKDNLDVVESVVLAVAGYSSFQGRILAETYASQYEPNLAIVFFGWNDHWLAYGAIDEEKKILPGSWLRRLAELASSNSRLYQGLNWVISKYKGSDIPLDDVRVTEYQYRENLKRIQEIFLDNDIPIIFITAPTTWYKLGIPDYLIEKGFALDKESLSTLHSDYNDIVREISQAKGSYLLDLEKEFNSIDDKYLRSMFWRDGIHLTQTGDALLASSITNYIASNILHH